MSIISFVETKSFYIEKCTFREPQKTMHCHHAYELYYILEGEREYFIGDTFFKVSKGDLVWIPANMLHRTDGQGATRMLVYFKPDFIHKYLQQPLTKRLLKKEAFVFHGDPTTDKQLIFFFNQLLAEYKKLQRTPDEADELLLAGYLFQLLFLMYISENSYVQSIPEDNRMSQIIKYINQNYAHISSMEEVADKFFISKYYLCRIFKQSIGTSFVSYLNKIRINAACELLSNENLFLSEIAIRCGFNSTPYFCKVFKDERGISPSEYRNNSR